MLTNHPLVLWAIPVFEMLKIYFLDMICKIIISSLQLHITGLNGLMCYYGLLCYIWYLYLLQDHSHIHKQIVVIHLILFLCLLIPWWPMHIWSKHLWFMCVIMFLMTLHVAVLHHQGIGRHSVGYVFTSNKNNNIMPDGTLVALLCFHLWYVYFSHRFPICGSISWYVYFPTLHTVV